MMIQTYNLTSGLFIDKYQSEIFFPLVYGCLANLIILIEYVSKKKLSV